MPVIRGDQVNHDVLNEDDILDEASGLVHSTLTQHKNKVQLAAERTGKRNWTLLRTKLAVNPAKALTGLQAFKYQWRLGWKKITLAYGDLADRLEVWGYWLKRIEGEFGNGVLSYFKFLKWLWFLNIYIFLLFTLFVVIPSGASDKLDYTSSPGNLSEEQIKTAIECSDMYHVTVNRTFVQGVLDFLQGTGWMEKTPMFYGDYADRRVSFLGRTYNLPLAYFCITLAYFALSLVLMCRQTNETLREQIIQNQYTTQVLGYANIIFGGWDYALSSEKSAYLKQRAMLNEIRGTLEEDRVRMKRKRRDTLQRIKLYFIRILINLIVIAILGGSGFLIYYATTFSAEMKSHEDYADKNQLEQFLFDFIPSLTITGLNAAIPILFAKIVKGEDYKPDFEIRMTLGRTVFLRLASVAVLMGSLYYQITCSPKDSCNVGTGDCVELRCWETFFGQQIYRLMIVNAVTKLGIIFFVEFPRKIIVTKIKFKLTELVGRQEFDIPKQVLDLVYGQTLCWLGAFFAPLTPVIFVILYFLLFYAMLATCMINYVPATKPYRSSKSHMFFMLVLITAFILCCIPIGYCIWQISPSRGCGPFRLYDNIYDILSITIDTSWPEGLRDTVHFFTSSGFLVGLFVCLILIIYYYKSAASGRNDIIQLLRDQISIESREKQFLLKRLNENGGAKSKGNDPGGTKYQSMGETQPLASP